MKEKQQNKKDYYVVDLQHICRSLLHRAWIIILAGLLAGAAALSVATFLIEPTYSSSVMLYVNNTGNSESNSIVSSSQIVAAQNLVKTYSVILKSRATLQEIIGEADLPYTTAQLSEMITSSAANDTEVLRVTVTTTDPQEACDIANVIAKVLPEQAPKIINGADVRAVDYAVPNNKQVAPSPLKYTVLGVLAGALISALVLACIAAADDRIHDEDYVFQAYDYPILAKVPNLTERPSKRHYGYYSQPKEK